MSLAQLLAAGFTPDLAIEAVRLLHEVVAHLEIVGNSDGDLVCAFVVSPEAHDALCAFAAFDDREPEGLEEDDGRELQRVVEPIPPPAPVIEAVAPVGTTWLVPLVPREAASPAVTDFEALSLNVAALLAGSGRHPRGPADWYRLQGAGRRRGAQRPSARPPVMVPVAGVCVA